MVVGGGRFDMDGWLAKTRIVVCVGAGGVGKTTTAATIGLGGALRGRKVMVLTIDPARRLANSLGLKEFGNEETKIDLASLGVQAEPGGELWAMMLDSRSTFDSLIARIAPDPKARDRILSNHVYRHMADTFAGSQDYMATEKLHDLVTGDRYDLVVLDTPPVKNALDFLEAPGRLINFLDERVLRWFVSPPGAGAVFGTRLMLGTSAVVHRLLSYVFGKDFLDDLTTFFEDFQGLYKGFVERHEEVLGLFHAPTTSFVTVCAPTESALDVATFFQHELARRELPRGGLVVNQVHACEGDTHDARATLGAVAEQALTRKAREAGRGGGFYVEIPRLDGNVHDLHALAEVGRRLFEPASVL